MIRLTALAVALALVAGSSSVAHGAQSAVTLSLAGPPTATYGAQVTIPGTASPVTPGVHLVLESNRGIAAETTVGGDGSFAFSVAATEPGPFHARADDGSVSNEVVVQIRPILSLATRGSRIVSSRLTIRAKLRPAAAGTLVLELSRNGKRLGRGPIRAGRAIDLPTNLPGRIRAKVTLAPAIGYVATGRSVRLSVGAPSLALGSQGPAVRALERSLRAHRFALGGIDGAFGQDTVDAVYALQKLAGLGRTGRMDGATWRGLVRSRPPKPRLIGSYIEVDKARQLLFVVRASRVAEIVHVSTGATGNTPLGLWHVYSKVNGWSWVLYYPSYFLRGFAIHGYPSVPPYPASHGCVRVPMWIAQHLFRQIPPGSRILIR